MAQRTPLFIEDNKMYADKPSNLSNTETNVINFLRADAAGAGALLVHEQYMPDMTLFVEGANNVYVNGSNLNYTGGSTPIFVPPVTGSRIDLVTIDATGSIVIRQNLTGSANYPNTERALAEVLLLAGDTVILDARITDVRQFFGAGINPNAELTTEKIGSDASNYPTNTVYSINAGTYTTGTGAVKVYIDGLRKILGSDYLESSNTTVTLTEPLLDTQNISIITNQLNSFDLSGKVNKTGDVMTGVLTLPEINLNSGGFYIKFSGSDMVFKDPNNAQKTLTQLASGGGGGGGSLTTIHGEYVASSLQTVFTVPTYPTGTNQLQVFVNGLLQRRTTHYTETNATTITFTTGLAAGVLVTVHAVV